MALFLTESDVHSLLTMPLALEAVEASFRRLAEGSAQVHSRHRLHIPGSSYLHYMAAADSSGGYMGLKIYTSSRAGLRFIVLLFHTGTGELLALIEADFLGQVRTGAASGVATRYMARPDARLVAIIGTGSQARTQLQAVALVRKLERIRAFGRDPERRIRFVSEMSTLLGLPVEPSASAEQAIRDADIVITATTASTPVVEGRWLRPGVHINAIGANFPDKRELDESAVNRAGFIAADSRAQSRLEAGDLIHAFGNDSARWAAVQELAEIVAGRIPGRTSPEQITLFKSNGIAIEDVVVAGRMYEQALKRGMGRSVPIWESEMRREARKV